MFLPAIAFAALATQAAASSTILPGYWESSNHAEMVISQDSTDRKCITAQQVDSYLAGPVTRHYSCAYEHREIGDGGVHLTGACVDRSGQHVDVDITGDYTPESFHLKAKLKTVFAGIPLAGRASIDAHRISAQCPDPAPHPTSSAPSP